MARLRWLWLALLLALPMIASSQVTPIGGGGGGGGGGSVTQGTTPWIIGDADGGALNVICDSGCSGGTQYAEDAVHVSGDLGTLALGVRKDTAASLAGTDGDYTASIYDSLGRLHVTLSGITAAAPLSVRMSDGTDQAAIDASGNQMVALGVATDRTFVFTLSDNAADRKLEMNAENNAFTNAMPVWAGKVRSSAPTLTNGNSAAPWLTVNGTLVSTLADTTGANLAGVSAEGVTLTARLGTHSGIVRSAAVASENTALINGQALPLATDGLGRLINTPYAHPTNYVSGTNSNTDGASTALIASGGTGVFTYITTFSCSNTSATNITVNLNDNVTTKWTMIVPTLGGNNITFSTPLRGSAATAWNTDGSAAATTLYCNAAGYQSKM